MSASFFTSSSLLYFYVTKCNALVWPDYDPCMFLVCVFLLCLDHNWSCKCVSILPWLCLLCCWYLDCRSQRQSFTVKVQVNSWANVKSVFCICRVSCFTFHLLGCPGDIKSVPADADLLIGSRGNSSRDDFGSQRSQLQNKRGQHVHRGLCTCFCCFFLTSFLVNHGWNSNCFCAFSVSVLSRCHPSVLCMSWAVHLQA